MSRGRSQAARAARRREPALPLAVPDLIRWHVPKAPDAAGRGDCRVCRGRCCTYVVVQIPRPRSKVELDEVRWWLAHRNVEVYIADRQWHVQFYTPCRHLTGGGRCRIYPRRYNVCRDHDAEDCEMSGSAYPDDASFRSPEEFDAYLAARRKRPRS